MLSDFNEGLEGLPVKEMAERIETMPRGDDSSTLSWNGSADDWVTHADTNDYRNQFLLPLTLAMLIDDGARRVLDLGCGEGGYSRALARRGNRVVGVDGSARLIEVARQRALAARLEIEYVCANANALDEIPPESFELVLASMSLMDVEDYPGAVREIHRTLESGGELFLSITHPCFSAPTSEWVRDDAGRPKFFAVDRYFERTAWRDLIARAFRAPVVRRHRPLEDYIGVLLREGFVLREFREPSVTGEDLKKSPRFEYLRRIPYFLFMRWRKP
jgi:ubiquinone/menaquinone biosynthesis C-methylase UbiE